ncbi:SOS response-associated peptidase [Halosegnis marinus]|uniref:SOS response-associated peptidase n=1 Tax=Halosegnis marinus TaxID=3034023 RepID=A0ABD5ZLU0_9EURY|nr:SOS response-associated peptidase [Halosegnis sp. DT85]
MCGRYSIFLPPDELAERFDVRVGDDYRAHYNASPSQSLPVVTNHDPDEVTHQRWGLIPSWADDDFSGLINARAETVAEKPAFADAYERRRCLVPADGYYEWVEREGGKQPYRITRADGEPFAMAGLWERWEPETTQTGLGDFGAGGPGGDDDPVETFTVVTTEANAFQSDYHHRMPVVLAPDEERAWLESPDTDLLDPYDGGMDAYPVSTRVNSPANDDPAVVEEVEG